MIMSKIASGWFYSMATSKECLFAVAEYDEDIWLWN